MEIARRNGSLARLDLRPIVQMMPQRGFSSGGFASSSAAQISTPSSFKEGAGGGSYADSAIIAKLDQMISRIEKIQPVVAIKTFEDERERYIKITQNSGL